ncbi:MAG TPA: dephospho-CoA kinase [Candidatus Baltobacteraceae bacterium]|jgi:dephospho-CoA kinase
MRVGLTGGIGSGKSEVSRFLDSFGAYVIDTDLLAREAVAPESDGLRAIGRKWPQVVRRGALDRAALAEIVFTDPSARAALNAIVHPHVRRLAIERERFAKPGQAIVHMVPLLFETTYADRMDRTILVVAPDDQRIARVVTRDRIGETQVRARMAAQIAPDEARARATYVIENDGDLSHLRERTRAVFDRLV